MVIIRLNPTTSEEASRKRCLSWKSSGVFRVESGCCAGCEAEAGSDSAISSAAAARSAPVIFSLRPYMFMAVIICSGPLIVKAEWTIYGN